MVRKDIPALTGLRFVAALAIVLDHAWPIIFKFDRLATLNNAMHQLGSVGMTLFFVLSGFIIHHNYAKVLRQRGGLRQFFVARFSRLYPLYILLLLIDFITSKPPLDWMAVRMLTLTQAWSYELIDGRFLSYGYHYSVVAWSISTEMFFYAVYPLISVGLRYVGARRAPLFALGSALGVAIAVWWINGHLPSFDKIGWFSYTSPYTRVLEFIVGCALAHAYQTGYTIGRPIALAAIAWISLFALRGFFGNEAFSGAMLRIGLLLPTAALIYAVATSDVFSVLRTGFVLRMGDASYSMYLLHLIVAEYAAFDHPVVSNHENYVSAGCRLISAVLVICVLSRLSYLRIEVPSRRLLRSLLSARASPINARIG